MDNEKFEDDEFLCPFCYHPVEVNEDCVIIYCSGCELGIGSIPITNEYNIEEVY